MRISRTALLAVTCILIMTAVPAAAETNESAFVDVPPSNAFYEDISWMAAAGITRGCTATGDRYCPSRLVTRGQMAAFLVRAFDFDDPGEGNAFVDDNESIFEADIDRLAAAGITRGCNPPDNDRYCPDQPVTRGQMATFLVRSLNLVEGAGINAFIDDDESVHEENIDRLAAAGITRGCNPPDNDRYCPGAVVTRAQMAAFLHRAIGGASVAGRVFEDADLDGVLDVGEHALSGVEVHLTGPTITRRSDVSDARGVYGFGPLEAGEFMVEVQAATAPTGSLLTTSEWRVMDLVAETVVTGLDFGFRTPAGLEEWMVGTWDGTNTNPWSYPLGLPYAISLEFRGDGTYSSSAVGGYTALYFGPDTDSFLKTYAITAVGPGGIGTGEIALVWVDNVTPVVRMAEIRTLEFDGPDRMTIELWDHKGYSSYGPVILDLIRSG